MSMSPDRLVAAEDLGAPVKVAGFIKFVLGEGIEKKVDNFVEEVMAQAQA